MFDFIYFFILHLPLSVFHFIPVAYFGFWLCWANSVGPCNTAEFRSRTFPACYDDSENCSEQPKTNEMGIPRAPMKFLTFVFLVGIFVIFDELSHFSLLGGTSSIFTTFLGGTSEKTRHACGKRTMFTIL